MDTAILSLMYESGCRVQELIDLKVEDLFFQNTDVVRLHGKGNKIRLVPISRNCSNIIKKYIKHMELLILANMNISTL